MGRTALREILLNMLGLAAGAILTALAALHPGDWPYLAMGALGRRHIDDWQHPGTGARPCVISAAGSRAPTKNARTAF
jgi:hypothetical protein